MSIQATRILRFRSIRLNRTITTTTAATTATATLNDKSNNRTDIAIFGGGIIGSSIAYFIKDKAPINLCVTYTRASTTLSVGGIRQQFSLPENIQLSMFTARFLQNIRQYLSILDQPPSDVAYHQMGYLTLADNHQASILWENFQIQKQYGASIEWLTNEQLSKKFPMINTNGIEAAVFGTANEGWFDPYRLLVAMKSKAKFLGTKFVHANVIGFHHDNDGSKKKCQKVIIRQPDGNEMEIMFDIGVVCTGYDSKQIAKYIGYDDIQRRINFPIEPRKRYVFVVDCRNYDPDYKFPFLLDKTGVYCRQESQKGIFICGRSPPTLVEEPEIDNLDVDYSFFDEYVHPILAERMPCFEALKIKSAWAGFYDYNHLDQNPIVGRDPFYSNIYWATGFSGHGIQMGPAIGHAMMELILNGRFETINLERFGWDRILNNRPLKERNIY
ncbi:fad-dependent oxidoreductase domain-containing protein 1-like protein [Dermatophagoides farinae]|uniref:FAD-dependent oxidoreductase domain-containing protein 1 n=1 Tax=Dermatophagoides farinae TaxID=6954 RepID=A0A9D4SCD1_DERFA|nr:fad-dependent oxidoreductase domain-containing protein 1-like protein [Dermatophagoides farinae]